MIELASACVLIWRLNVELRHGQAFSERAERTASKIGGGLLFALAAYMVAGAAWSLWTRHGEEAGRCGKDAVESITCGWLSLVVVIGLIADLLLGAVTSLAIVWFVVKEGREAWKGEDCCEHD